VKNYTLQNLSAGELKNNRVMNSKSVLIWDENACVLHGRKLQKLYFFFGIQ
jgi:hypothetical protein